MAERNKLLEIINSFPIGDISEDWVKSVWESDFTEVGGLNEEIFQETDNGSLTENLHSLACCLNHWIGQQSESDDGLWTVFAEAEISLKMVQAFLAYILLTGHKKTSSISEKELAISAAMVYVKLVLVPGSSAFKVFHPELFEKSLDFMKLYITLVSTESTKRKRSSPTSSQNSQPGRKNRNGRKKKNSNSVHEESTGDGIEEESDTEEQEISPQEINKLCKQLHKLLITLVEFLEVFSLRQSPSSGYHSVQVLAPLTKHEPELFDGDFNSSIPKSRMSVPHLAFKGLSALCAQLHGNVSTLLNTTFKLLLPNLLMLVDGKAVQNIAKRMVTTRDIAVEFVCLLIKQCGDRGLTSGRTLIQHMCTKVTDRAEYRTRVSQAVVQITSELPTDSYCSMLQWFHKLSRHSQLNNRGFALEIVSALLNNPERPATDRVPPALQTYMTHRSLLAIILDRCSDKAPTVRARAITCFAQFLTPGEDGVARTVKEMMTPMLSARAGPNMPRLIRTPGASIRVEPVTMLDSSSIQRTEATICQQTGVEGSVVAMETAKEGETPLNRVHLTPGFDPNMSDSEGVFSMMRRRARDERVNVRKAAISALELAVRFEMPYYTKQNVEVLQDHCRDPGLSVRKQALQSLTALLEDYTNDNYIQTCWLKGVLPLVIDRETTLSDKCMETLEELVLHNVVPVIRSKSECHTLCWKLLNIIAKPHSVDQRRYLQKACHHWSRQGKIKPTLLSSLESHVGTENNAAAWMLLAEIAPAAPKINHAFLLKYWHKAGNQSSSTEIMERVLTVMKYAVKHLPAEERDRLIADLKARLLKFDSPPELISVTVATLGKLCKAQSTDTGDVAMATGWSHELLTACDKYLSKVVLEKDGVSMCEDQIVCYLFTLGEVVQLCPGKVPKRVFLLVQSMIATPCIPPNLASQSTNTSTQSGQTGNTSTQSTQSDPAADTSGSSQRSTQSGQPLTQPLTQFRGSHMSSRIRAFAFITLGKLCLQHEDLAKKCIAALARELEISTDPAIRNNVMIVMCDLCVRYTTTTNHYIPNIASCLKDPSALVRKQTATLITRLLQEDFLKWKGALFYKFISVLLDDCEEIRKFAEFCLLHMLIQRHPNMFFQHFLECVFHFNDYRQHSVYNKFAQSDKDREMFSLKGPANRKKRDQLYRFLLENMSDNHKFQMQGKIVQEILGAMVDGLLPMNEETSHLLKDALTILSSKEIKLSSLKVRPQEEEATDEQEMAAVVVATAKKTIITQVVKKNVIENIVPVVVSLKHMMEKQRSPLLKELLTYLHELMKDYKTEVKDILSADRQLATEIEFDLRKFEEQQKEATVMIAAPSVQGTPQAAAASNKSPVPTSTGTTAPSRHRSPLASPGPRTISPRIPALKSASATPNKAKGAGGKSTVGTPPIMRIVPDKTPAREAPLVNQAVLNSAYRATGLQRKALHGGISNTDRISSPSYKAGMQAMTPRSANTTNISERAISTPSVAMSNITFHSDGNMTFMPPSPIQESAEEQRLFDDDDSCAILVENKEAGDRVENVLLLKSPMAAPAKPRVWNVTSPAPKKLLAQKQLDADDIENTGAAGDGSEIKRKAVATSRPKRLGQENKPEVKTSQRTTRSKRR